MSWWLTIRIFWTILAFLILSLTILVIYRARGVFVWKKSLKKELNSLGNRADQISGPAGRSLIIIENRCKAVLKSSSPEIGELKHLYEYIRSIASCYHPESDHPELQVTIGPLLNSIEQSLERFDQILNRPIFKRLRKINIRNIKNAKLSYSKIMNSNFYLFYARHRNKFQKVSILRFFIFYDPFMWLAYLSNKLTTLLLIKYLLVDLYLFFGKLTMTAFDDQANAETIGQNPETQENLEKILEELNSIQESVNSDIDPKIKEIRSKLVGFTSVLLSNPGFLDWKKAVYDAAEVIAKKYFPKSKDPLEEAAIGPLLERSRAWIGTLSKGEEYLLARRFYQLRLKTLYQAKNFSDIFLPEFIKKIIKKTYQTYGMLKWPWQVYRWVKKRSPWSIALEVGWQAAKKASLAHIYGKAFDKAYKELDIVYFQSIIMKKGRGRGPSS